VGEGAKRTRGFCGVIRFGYFPDLGVAHLSGMDGQNRVTPGRECKKQWQLAPGGPLATGHGGAGSYISDGWPCGADRSEVLGIAQVTQEAKRLTPTKRPQGAQQAGCRFSAILDASLQVHGNGALSS
jgi:hypothetical protein